jgi:hypothetical protein
MSSYVCSVHGSQFIVDPSPFPGCLAHCSATLEGFNPNTGKPNRCQFRVRTGQAAAASAPAAAAAAPIAATIAPRLTAAIAALQAAATRHSGMISTVSPDMVMVEASRYYHQWLRKCVTGEPPTRTRGVKIPGP